MRSLEQMDRLCFTRDNWICLAYVVKQAKWNQPAVTGNLFSINRICLDFKPGFPYSVFGKARLEAALLSSCCVQNLCLFYFWTSEAKASIELWYFSECLWQGKLGKRSICSVREHHLFALSWISLLGIIICIHDSVYWGYKPGQAAQLRSSCLIFKTNHVVHK